MLPHHLKVKMRLVTWLILLLVKSATSVDIGNLVNHANCLCYSLVIIVDVDLSCFCILQL